MSVISNQSFNTLFFQINNETFTLDMYGDINEPWFIANQVGKILGIQNIRQNLQGIDEEWKSDVTLTYGRSGSKKTTLINEMALYHIIMRSDKSFAKHFQKWVYNMIKNIRLNYNHSSYLIDQQIKETKTRYLENATRILKDIDMFDDRAKALVSSNLLDVMNNNEIKSNPDDEEVSVSRRVQEKYGFNLDSKKHHSVLCAIGNRLAKKYKSFYGNKPIKRSQFVYGTLRDVCHYTRKNWNECLDAILEENKHFFTKTYFIKNDE